MKSSITRWAIQWRSQNKLDGYTEHFVWDWKDSNRVTPVLFNTRKEAREFNKDRHVYLRYRPDLKAEPHGWKMPRVVKVNCEIRLD